jgi:hypothetical protein
MVPTNDTTRRAVLEEGSDLAGTRWALGFREELRREGRPAAGGWPGTMSEARARVAAHFRSELSRRRMQALTHAECEWAARNVYAAARRNWLLHEEPEQPER